MKAVLDKAGRMVLPKRVRDDFGLAAGHALEVLEDGERIILRPERNTSALYEKGGLLVFRGKAQGDLDRVLKRMRRQRMNKVGGSGIS